jgi:hypothetical protein
MKLYFRVFFSLLLLSGCGTLGHLQFYYFNADKYKVEKDLVHVINADSTHAVPEKWNYAATVGFLHEKYVYFNNSPEEMYQIGFTGDSSEWDREGVCKLSLDGIFKWSKWEFEGKISSSEEKRVEKRFETEILARVKYKYKTEE